MAIKKTKRLTVRWEPQDLQHIKKQAAQVGVSPSRYVREVALTKRSQDGKVIAQAKLLDDLIQQVRAIGTNLNQIARRGNQLGQVKPQRIEAIHQQLDAIRNRIYEELP